MPHEHASTTIDVDLAVLGAGPTGLWATYSSGFRGLSTCLIDALPEPGGQVAALYPEKPLFDIPGHPRVLGRELVRNLTDQLTHFPIVYRFGEQATTLARLEDGVLVVGTDAGTYVRCRALVVTAGIGAFNPRPLPAAADYQGSGVDYFVQSLDAYKDADVVIVGGGDSAVDWALNLGPLARSVTVVHRRDMFRAHAHSVAQLRASEDVEIVAPAELVGISGNAVVEEVTIRRTDTKLTETRPCQRVVAALGFTAKLGPINEWGLELTDHRIPVNQQMQTCVPGVYAAGDIATYQGRVPLLSVAFGEAATAVNNAAVTISPDLELFPGHSSDRSQEWD